MITDNLSKAAAFKNGWDGPAEGAGSAASQGEVPIPAFLERKYNLDILRRQSTWPWVALSTLPSSANGSGRVDAGGRSLAHGRRAVGPGSTLSWQRDAFMLAVGSALGVALMGGLALAGVIPASGKSGQNDSGSHAATPTATVPVVVIASPILPEVVATPEGPAPEITATEIQQVTVTPEEMASPTALPTDTAIPTRQVPPTRPAPPRPTKTVMPPPEATPTEEFIVTSTPVPTAEPVATEEEATPTSEVLPSVEPTSIILPDPTEVPTPLPGIITPTEPPTPLPGILTPTPEAAPDVVP